MNDGFENKLRQHSPRRAPREWREEILRAANPPEKKSAEETVVPFWRLIFGQYPMASAAFAGFWIVLIAVNVILFGPASGSRSAQRITRGDELSLWQLQSVTLQQLASDDELAAESPAPAPPKMRPSPRSEWRREDQGVGQTLEDRSLNHLA